MDERCNDADSGARNIYDTLTGMMLEMSGEGIKRIHVSAGEDEKLVYNFS